MSTLDRLLAAFPRDERKTNPDAYVLPRKLIALDEPLRTLAARAWLETREGKEWAKRTDHANDESDRRHP